MIATPTLNPAQQAAVDHPPGPILVLAGAGSGKTRVLTARIARLLTLGTAADRVLAFTFTNRAAREMRERIGGTVGDDAARLWVGTFHGTGVRILRREAARGALEGLPADFTIYDREDQEGVLREVMAALELPEAFKLGDVLARISDAKSALVTPAEAERAAVSPWERRIAETYGRYQAELRRRGALDFDDLIAEVVRLFRERPETLERYARKFEHVLVDEYQDTNHAQFRLVAALASVHKNLFAVGDEDQCLVAGTQVTMGDGTTRPIEQVSAGDLVRSACGSGEFRPSRVLRVHRRECVGEGVEILTRGGVRVVSTPEHTHFAGYVSGVSPQMHFTYLMYRRGVGYRLGTTQVYTRGQQYPVMGYVLRTAHERGDALWIVGAHATEGEARLDEYLLSLRHRIPTLPFKARYGAGMRERTRRGLVDDPAAIDRVFAEFGTVESAMELLASRGMTLTCPHYRPRSRNSSRRNVVVTLCGDRRGVRPMHRISMVGNDFVGRLQLEELGLSVRPAKDGSASWRHETVRASYSDLLGAVDRIGSRFDVNVLQMARLGVSGGARETNSLPFIPAGSVLPGMAMFDANGGYDVVESVRRVTIEEDVYDLDVEDTHNYIANGLITHNSIYRWRGADLSNILDFETSFPGAAVLRLEQNYRSTGNILKAANAVIANNRDRRGKTLWCDREDGPRLRFVLAADEVDEAKRIAATLADRLRGGGALQDCAVLYRTNAQSRALETELRQRNMPYEIVGGVSFYQRREVKDVLAYLRLAVNPTDLVAFWRAWNTPRRGLGDAVRARVETRLAAGAANALQALREVAGEGDLSRPARAGAEDFLGLLEELRARVAEPADLLVALVLQRTGYLAMLDQLPPGEAAERRANVEELAVSAGQFAAARIEGGLAAWLAETALLTDADRLTEGADRVLLLTAHNAKGLEFPLVIVAGLEEGLLPHGSSLESPAELEEERRLFYVAITRARDEVLLTAAAYRRRFDGARGGQVSRFVDEIPEELLEREEHTAPAWGGSTTGGNWPAWSSGGGTRTARRTETADAARSGPAYRTRGALAKTVGREVFHDSFGRGVVVAAEGSGADLKFTVRFGTRIVKVLGRFLTGGSDGD